MRRCASRTTRILVGLSGCIPRRLDLMRIATELNLVHLSGLPSISSLWRRASDIRFHKSGLPTRIGALNR
jgi:hypothetical protein